MDTNIILFEKLRRDIIAIRGGDGQRMTEILFRLLSGNNVTVSIPSSQDYSKIDTIYVDKITGDLIVVSEE